MGKLIGKGQYPFCLLTDKIIRWNLKMRCAWLHVLPSGAIESKEERKAFSRTYLFTGVTLYNFLFLRGVRNRGEREFRGLYYNVPSLTHWPDRESRNCGSPYHTGSWQPGFRGHLWVRTAFWATWWDCFPSWSVSFSSFPSFSVSLFFSFSFFLNGAHMHTWTLFFFLGPFWMVKNCYNLVSWDIFGFLMLWGFLMYKWWSAKLSPVMVSLYGNATEIYIVCCYTEQLLLKCENLLDGF